MTVRGLVRLLIAVFVGLSAAVVGLAGNAAAGQQHWPGPLDLVRTHPWPTVGVLVVVGVLTEVLLWALSRRDPEPVTSGPGGTTIRVGRGGTVLVNPPSPAVPGPAPADIRNIPPRTRLFTGRDDMLARLHTRLGADGSVVVRALHGWGGVGKTTLAIEYAHRYAGDYQIVWWIDAEQPSLIGEQWAALAVAAGWVPEDTATGKAAAIAREHLHTRGGWLVVFDNATTPAEVRDWLPDGPGQVIVTSRYPHWEQVATGAVEVDVFSRDEAVALLHRLAPRVDEAVAIEICRELGDLPLAITQAGSVLAETGITGSAYLARLREHAGQAMGHGQAAGYARSLAAAVQISADQVAREDVAALQLLRVCAMLAPEPVPLDLLFATPTTPLPEPLRTVALDPLEWGERVRRLGRYGLVKPTSDGPVMHRLTQAVIVDQLAPDARTEMCTVADGLLTAAQPVDPTDPVWWPVWARLLPHLLARDPAGSDNANVWWMADQATYYLLAHGDVTAGYALAHQLYEAWRPRLGDDHFNTLGAAHNLAIACHQRGDIPRALELDQDTLARRRRVFGDDDPNSLISAKNLAADLYMVGRVEEALTLDEDTLARYRRVLGDDDPSTLRSATGFAADLYAVGRVQESLALDEDTLARYRRVLGSDHPETLVSANNLAFDLYAVGRTQEAMALHEDTFARRRRVLGDDHPDTLVSASNVANDLLRAGRVQEAVALYEDTLARRRRVLGDDHPDTLASASNLRAAANRR